MSYQIFENVDDHFSTFGMQQPLLANIITQILTIVVPAFGPNSSVRHALGIIKIPISTYQTFGAPLRSGAERRSKNN